MEVCRSSLNIFCYVCGHYSPAYFTEIPNDKRHAHGVFSEEFKRLYEQYFNRKIDLNGWWVPKIVCKICYDSLFDWNQSNGEKQMKFGIPMIWTQPAGDKHVRSNCYACANFVPGFGVQRMIGHTYKSVESAQLPIGHGPNIPFKYPATATEPPDDQQVDTIFQIPHLSVLNESAHLLTPNQIDAIVSKLLLIKSNTEELSKILKKNEGMTFPKNNFMLAAMAAAGSKS